MRGTRGALSLVVLPLAAAVLAGCGGGSGGYASTSSAAAGGSSAAGSGQAGAGAYGGARSHAAGGSTSGATTVVVTESEFSISLSRKTFTPGVYTFEIRNAGRFPHNLDVQGPGVTGQASPVVQPGTGGSLTVTLGSGRYELWCAVDHHRDMGMDTMITVG